MLIKTKYRSSEPEIMDDLSMEGDMLRKTLDQIALINRRLGGNHATLSGLFPLLHIKPPGSVYRIIDLGCGNGDMLRAVADHGRKNKLHLQLTGIDANNCTIAYARELSMAYPEISYVEMNVFDIGRSHLEFDIALATLFLHHFTNTEITGLLHDLVNKAGTGIVINDLHRCRAAYYLFKFISIFIANPMVKHDGAISVLRGFKKKELIELSKQPGHTNHSISWKWAFRYQWIIKKQ